MRKSFMNAATKAFRSNLPSTSSISRRPQSIWRAHAAQFAYAQQRHYSGSSQVPPTSGGGSTTSGPETGRSDETGNSKEKKPYAKWYGDLLPAMIPIALLGSAVYLGLKLVQLQLSTEKSLDEANARILLLETQVNKLLEARKAQGTEYGDKNLPPVIDNQKSSRWWFASA